MTSNTDHKPLGESRKAVLRQLLMVSLGNTGVLAAGMTTSLPAVTLNHLTDTTEEFHLSQEEASWYSSIITVGCPFGSVLSGVLLDRIGRKTTIVITDLWGVLFWGLIAAAPFYKDHTASVTQILIARFISGIQIGMFVASIGVYAAEISLPRIRGRLILCTSIAIASGNLFMYALGYFIRHNWQLIAFISTLYQTFSTICALPLPESPSWLMQHGHAEKARRSLKYYRGLDKNDDSYNEEFENELNQIKKTSELSRNKAETESLLQAIKAPEVYKPILLMITYFALQHCSGIPIVLVYTVQFATSAGGSIDPWLCAVMVGLARIIITLFMNIILEGWGRKAAGVISAIGMTICMFLLAFSGWFPEEFKKVPIIPAICIVLHIVFAVIGLLTLPLFMSAEIFPQRVRGKAAGFSSMCGFVICFIVIKLYPAMVSFMGPANLFALYGLVSLAAAPFILFLIPETKGRTLLEIEEYFKTGRMALPTEGNLSSSTPAKN